MGMARSPLAAAMVGKTIGKRINEGQIPMYVERFGSVVDEIFVTARLAMGRKLPGNPSPVRWRTVPARILG